MFEQIAWGTVFMYMAAGAIGLFLLVKTTRDKMHAEEKERLREAEEIALIHARSPHRLACPSCGAQAHKPCNDLDGVSPWEPHAGRKEALYALLSTESKAQEKLARWEQGSAAREAEAFHRQEIQRARLERQKREELRQTIREEIAAQLSNQLK